jgi:hypothetical protein
MKSQTPRIFTAIDKTALLFIAAVTCVFVGGLVWYGPIAQDQSYHSFADQRTLLDIPHFWNVISNFPFVLFGLLGLHRCIIQKNNPAFADNRMAYILFFTGALLTGTSSGYYHFQPDNWSLFWDRLTMSISFMTFLVIVINARISRTLGKQLLTPLILFGFFSVLYWITTEQLGVGDLRPYVITQFLPILIISFIIYFRPSHVIRVLKSSKF